jgi:hypothetical protein
VRGPCSLGLRHAANLDFPTEFTHGRDGETAVSRHVCLLNVAGRDSVPLEERSAMLTKLPDRSEDEDTRIEQMTPREDIRVEVLPAETAIAVAAPRGFVSRRRLLQLLLAVPAAGLITALPPLVGPAAAEVFTIIAAVVGIVVSVVRLLGSSGPSIGSLLHMQMQLMAKISAQLDVLHRTMNLILTRLDDIEHLIGQTPVRTVEAINKHRILGLSQLYGEKMRAHTQVVQTSGGLLTVAQERYGSDIRETIVRPLQMARVELMTIDSVFNVPVVATALQVEVHSMLMAGYDRPSVSAALASYEAWFERTRLELGQMIAVKRKERAALRVKLQNATCKSACADPNARQVIERSFQPRTSRAQRESGSEPGPSHYTDYSASGPIAEFTYSTGVKKLPALKEGLDRIMAARLLTPADLPVVVSATAVRRERYVVRRVNGQAVSDNDMIPPSSIEAFVTGLQTCGPNGPLEISPEAAAIESGLGDTGLSLISLAGLQLACDAGITACRTFASQLPTSEVRG